MLTQEGGQHRRRIMQVYIIPLTAGGGMVEAVSEARIFAAKRLDDVLGCTWKNPEREDVIRQVLNVVPEQQLFGSAAKHSELLLLLLLSSCAWFFSRATRSTHIYRRVWKIYIRRDITLLLLFPQHSRTVTESTGSTHTLKSGQGRVESCTATELKYISSLKGRAFLWNWEREKEKKKRVACPSQDIPGAEDYEWERENKKRRGHKNMTPPLEDSL